MEDRVLAYLDPRDLELGPPPSPSQPFRHWRLGLDDDNVLWALIDQADASANVLSAPVLEELDAILARVAEQRPAGLVIRSAKPSGFIAGADINQFRGVTDPQAIEGALGRAHQVVDRLEALTIPTIAVVHGYALGGGLEIALACHTRIAIEHAKFGFPEIQLGLHPGLGGTARFTRLVDPLAAMQLMLTGKSLDARKAKAIGLVDAVIPERHVRAAVAAAVAGQLEPAAPGLLDRLKDAGPARRIAAGRMRAEVARTAAPEHYPAPNALIALWETHGGDVAAMKAAEVSSFARLLVTPTAQNLIRVFFLREKLKGLAGGPSKVKRLHVIGAGAMGGDIAAWAAWNGLTVTLNDVKAEPVGGAVKRAAALYDKIGRDDPKRARDALDRLIPDLKGAGAAVADLVIEAAPEKIELKEKIYADLEPRLRPDAILASNTSSIPLETLREKLARPERLVGLHFFNPVSRMQLVEVVRHDRLDFEVEKAARAFAGAIDRLPAPARSAPGFIVNRALTPYLAEALALIDEGVAKEAIDQAAVDFGMPVGPVELADQVGLDICLDVADMLKRSLGWPLPDAPQWLRDKVAAKTLGRKTGEGLYLWKNGEAVKAAAPPAPPPGLADRLILPMLNTCVALLREGVSDDPDVIDAAMIFGSGFAPFRGGPLHYARARGVDEITAALETLAGQHGERFKPDAGWSQLR